MNNKFELISITQQPRGHKSAVMNIAITPLRVGFSAELYRTLNQPQYVQFYSHGSQVLIKPCNETDPCALRVLRLSNSGAVGNREMARRLLKMAKRTDAALTHVNIIALTDDGALFDMTKAY